jgi:hypothetical protein
VWLLPRLLRRPTKQPDVPAGFFSRRADVEQLNLRNAVKRVAKSYKSDLVFDPIGYHEYEWLVEQDSAFLVDLVFEHYRPQPQEILNMPKRGFTFRPVAYLSPIDSILYQAIVDKIISYKRKYFSRQVFSEIIEDTKKPNVFNNPVDHWLQMREGIRSRYRQGSTFYFFSDISGYFENIKIRPLLDRLKFYVGRNETHFLPYLSNLLEAWHFAKAQGLIQPHNASSILGKIYLSPVDSHFAHLQKDYSRYVDEFHLLAKDRASLLKSALELSEQLRKLGLNQNASKSKLLTGPDVLAEFDKDQDFFNQVSYLRSVKHDYEEADKVTYRRFDNFVADFRAGNRPNVKVFRYCIRKFGNARDPRGVDFCFEMAKAEYDQIVDIVRYLFLFAKATEHSPRIAAFLDQYLKNRELCFANWVEAWLLGLVLELNDSSQVDLEFVGNLAKDANCSAIIRSLCYQVLTKRLPPGELVLLYDAYSQATSPILKRALLACLSKLPSTSFREFLSVEKDDTIDLRVLKAYLSNRSYPDECRIS